MKRNISRPIVGLVVLVFAAMSLSFDLVLTAELTRNQNANSSTTTQNTAQADLSGTYTGTFICDAAGLNGETTLTINGNEFTTAEGKSGRIVATTTRGYTAVALQVNDGTTTPTSAPTILSLRA